MTKITYEGKGQVSRLSQQHTQAGGVSGIFGLDARSHDLSTKQERWSHMFEQLKAYL